MPNIIILLQAAPRIFFLSAVMLIFCFFSSILSPKAFAGPMPVFYNSAPMLLKAQKKTVSPSFSLKQKHSLYQKKFALRAIEIALTRVADGGAYRWRYKRSRLEGKVKPTTTYKNAAGQLCRHIHYSLKNGSYQKKSQALACRNTVGNWVIKG